MHIQWSWFSFIAYSLLKDALRCSFMHRDCRSHSSFGILWFA